MAILEKIRVKFGLAATIIIALGLLSFIIDPSSLMSTFQVMSSKNSIGQIGGSKIAYTDFQEGIDNMTTVNEILTGSSVQGEEQQKQIREAVWQDMLSRFLLNKNAQNAGLYVGEDELVQLTSGDNASPIITQNPAFMDQNGVFSKENLVTFLENVKTDNTGRLKTYWDYIQTTIANQQYQSKYYSLFAQSGDANPLIVKTIEDGNNNTFDISYVSVPYGYQPDSTIKVTDAEIKEFYNAHKKFFKQQESRDIEYVVFEVKPSAEDIAAANKEVLGLYDEFAATDNVKNFITKNSDRKYTGYWYKKGELQTVNQEVEDFVWSGDGNVSKVIEDKGKFYVARVVETSPVPDSVYVRHILLQGADAKIKADSLLKELSKGASFSALASLYSADQGSADAGERGNIGWLTQTYMIPGLESVITAQVGKPYTVDSQYGTHIVEVVKKTAPIAKKQVAIFEREALASKETFGAVYAKANQFATASVGGYEKYRKAVDTLGVYSHPVKNMLMSSESLGAIPNTKEITRWAFDNKAGKVSNIITVDNNYFFIATVTGVHREGYSTVQEASSSIRQQLSFKKMGEKALAEVTEKVAGLSDINAVAEKLGTSVMTQSALAFSSLNAQRIDPALVGAASAAPEGKLSGPVKGAIGVYMFVVTARNAGAFFTADDARNAAKQNVSYKSQMLLPVLMSDADVKDNRARFF